MPFGVRAQRQRVCNRIASDYYPSSYLCPEPPLQLSAGVALQEFDLRAGLWRTTDHVCCNQMHAGRGITFARLAQHHGIVHRSRGWPISIEHEQRPIDGRAVGSVIEGCGAVPLNLVLERSIASLLAVQEATGLVIIHSQDNFTSRAAFFVDHIHHKSLRASPQLTNTRIFPESAALQTDGKLTRQHLHAILRHRGIAIREQAKEEVEIAV